MWHCIRYVQSSIESAACPTDMKGIMRVLENLCGDTRSIIDGGGVFAEFVIDASIYIPYIGKVDTARLGYGKGAGYFRDSHRNGVSNFPIYRS